MEKKMQVYISSTYHDLSEEHEFVKQVILDAKHIPTDIKFLQDFSPTIQHSTLITETIEESDIFILIIGGKYGPQIFSNRSQIDFEYLIASKLNKPIFVFQLSDQMLNQKDRSGFISIPDIHETKYKNEFYNFKRLVLSKHTVLNIDNEQQFKIRVVESLIAAEDHLGLNGWVRAEKHHLLQEIKRLQRELEKIESKNEIMIKVTSRPSTESRQTKLGSFTYEEILYALTSRSVDIGDNQAKEFGFKTRYPTLLELLMEYHMLLSRGVTYVNSNSLDEMLKAHLIPVLLSLGMMEDSQQMIGDIQFEKTKLSANGLILVGKIYAGVFQEIKF
ncbi:hypothetical protein AYO36_15865 [Exiguobacterium sp. KKBO11]|uniref:DUF4062 domain-containing protein n=1 Tax=Exiguobacterium sp. KKBO11 TaxID=1805000 RepID=UPI0007D75519|nr:DUF4062 domain-containing protein [Exiguobacterium sp. KKBO11]OAI82161.1 hypothetical protein AYO36_15865 [Exiguobacterium sp. KKBO11]